MKRTKKFNQEWAEAIALMPYGLQASINDAIRSYQNDGIVPVGLHPLAQALFIVIKPTIDARARRSAYQKARRQRSRTSCLHPAEPKSIETPKSVETPTSVKTPRAAAPELIESPVVSEKVPADKTARPEPRLSNRFLRQVERARSKAHHPR